MLAVDKLNNVFQGVVLPEIATNNVAIGASSTQSAAFNEETRLIRVYAPVNCRIEVGTNPTASASQSVYMPAGRVEYFGVRAGHKLAVIGDSTTGTLNITEYN